MRVSYNGLSKRSVMVFKGHPDDSLEWYQLGSLSFACGLTPPDSDVPTLLVHDGDIREGLLSEVRIVPGAVMTLTVKRKY